MVPFLAVPVQQLSSQQFRDFLEDFELYCEKMRHFETIRFKMYLIVNPYTTEKRQRNNDRDYHEKHMEIFRLVRDLAPEMVVLKSPHVGEWECSFEFVFSDETGQCSSLVECVNSFVEDKLKW